jgi:glycine/D-amino acid oxidase-like deaminating enzyme
MRHDYDVIVAGAGMVGAAIGYGLAKRGERVLMLDGADADLRAAKANFGLVWAHGKGFGHPAYQRLSVQAVMDWPDFARQLIDETGIDVAYQNDGGLQFCLGEDELAQRAMRISAWHAQTPELAPGTLMLDRNELQRRFPIMPFGPEVAGASFGQHDGHVNPLRLLAALHLAYQKRGGELRSNCPVTAIRPLPGGGFEVASGSLVARAAKVVIAAGLGSAKLGPMVGLHVPLRPQRGQLLVTERLAPLLPIPASGLRQTAEGTVMIGVTQEEVGFDLATTAAGAVRMVRRALRTLPVLARARLVRQWACLRVMTPDGNPVYAHSASHPGASIVTCHSGVTLASFHAGALADALRQGSFSSALDIFHHDRFIVPKAA